MRRLFAGAMLLACVLAFPGISKAASEPVRLLPLENKTPWVGAKVTVVVEITVPGYFSGETDFDLPKLPGALLMRPDAHAVVSSTTVDGVACTVQRHELALFPERSGVFEIPAIPVRFGSVASVGKTPETHTGTIPAFRLEAKLPPGAPESGPVVTTPKLEVKVVWNPGPGPAKTGDAFTRTVTLRATDLPAMILPLPDHAAPAGVAVYPKQPALKDDSERGDFTGERTDTVDFVFEKPGDYRLPATALRWWNPEAKTWNTATIPAVTFKVAAGPGYLAAREKKEAPRRTRLYFAYGVATALALGAIAFGVHDLRRRRREPEAVRFRALLTACAANRAEAAYDAFTRWADEIPVDEPAWIAVQEAVAAGDKSWLGDALAKLARRCRNSGGPDAVSPTVVLPPLNP